jgi:DNA-binding MarR family transcriptional regulator
MKSMDGVMPPNIDADHEQAVLDFMMFLNNTFSRTSITFEDETACSAEEASVLRVIAQHDSIMVKDIAQALPRMDASKLTRLLDSLEKKGNVTRVINPGDRRSFLIAPTERGLQLLNRFSDNLRALVKKMMATLTPTERLILVELFNKIYTNWSPSE